MGKLQPMILDALVTTFSKLVLSNAIAVPNQTRMEKVSIRSIADL